MCFIDPVLHCSSCATVSTKEIEFFQKTIKTLLQGSVAVSVFVIILPRALCSSLITVLASWHTGPYFTFGQCNFRFGFLGKVSIAKNPNVFVTLLPTNVCRNYTH